MIVKFREQISAKGGDNSTSSPPFVIRASDLDKNFALCYPLPVDGDNSPYKIERPSDEGFRFVGNAMFDVCENGQPVKYRFFAEKMASP